ncbi:unnamed protein product [Phytophthora fragariaefolia]|uniref:Unnamed protein product n=1 Tax=Phytophthora fragariaefolia TaxID=1490495 RepID=A0A9W6U0Q3_9STRA|nr:unnamed protein product [Phytophthora fragariaefolia]
MASYRAAHATKPYSSQASTKVDFKFPDRFMKTSIHENGLANDTDMHNEIHKTRNTRPTLIICAKPGSQSTILMAPCTRSSCNDLNRCALLSVKEGHLECMKLKLILKRCSSYTFTDRKLIESAVVEAGKNGYQKILHFCHVQDAPLKDAFMHFSPETPKLIPRIYRGLELVTPLTQ